MCLTYPHIGNVGANLEDEESAKPYIEALIVREFSPLASNWRSSESAQQYLERYGVPVIWDLDTRALVRHLRDVGALRGVVSTDGTPAERLVAEARALPTMAGQELAGRVTCAKSYGWTEGSIDLAAPAGSSAGRGMGSELQARKIQGASSAEVRARRKVVAYDFGIKQNILRLLVDHGCEVTVVPARTSAADVLALKPDGVFLSNGPGDPEPIDYAVENIRKLMGRRADFRDLPGAPALRPGAWWQDIQIKIWASRLESSGEESAHGESGNHRAESRILRGPGFVAGQRCGNHAREFE